MVRPPLARLAHPPKTAERIVLLELDVEGVVSLLGRLSGAGHGAKNFCSGSICKPREQDMSLCSATSVNLRVKDSNECKQQQLLSFEEFMVEPGLREILEHHVTSWRLRHVTGEVGWFNANELTVVADRSQVDFTISLQAELAHLIHI